MKEGAAMGRSAECVGCGVVFTMDDALQSVCPRCLIGIALSEDESSSKEVSAVTDPAEAIGVAIGPYEIIDVLGEGGMGIVYLAEQSEPIRRRVALKLIKLGMDTREVVTRFESERQALALMDHPNIAMVHEAGVTLDGRPYFVMEYVDGLPLTTFCERHELSLRRRLELFRRVCSAVQHAHRQALIHRDLKPSNIFAIAGGQGAEASIKLLDFGIAKQIDEGRSQSLTATAFGIMTPAYAAPEQLRGHTVGVGTDVYSLGVVLYELLTGSLPFDFTEQTPFEAAETVISREPLRPSAKGFTFSAGRRAWADLDVLCLTAMHKDPERRYATVEALGRDVDHYLCNEPLEARPDSVRYRLGKFVRRNFRAVSTAAAVLSAVVALVAFYTVRLSAARDAALAEAARTQRVQRFMLGLFEGGDDFAGPEEGLQVETLIEQGVREARVLDGEPLIQAELYQTLGEVYHKMSDFDAADEMLQLALRQRRSLLGNGHPDVAQSLMALALLGSDRETYEDAERLAREALEIAGTAVPEEHPLYAESLGALGHVLGSRGEYEQAIVYLEQAFDLQERRDDTEGLMATLGMLADNHFYKGDYEGSDRLNRRLLALVEENLGTSHPSYASVMINLASSRRWLGYLEEAEQLYRDALPINESYHGRDHPATASNLNLIGAVLTDQEKYDEARVYLDEALAVRTKVFGPNHTRTARTVNQLARAQLAGGDLDAAETSFLREYEIYVTAVGPEHPWTATAMSNMASIHYRREEWEKAEEVMRRSLAIYVAALDPGHVDIAIGRIKLGRLLAGLERYPEAAEELTAGYDLLTAQANPSMSWRELARKELVAVWEALGDEARAAGFRSRTDENTTE